ncbi:hypothetical protein VE00_06983 [Pseudogymnoascus sp. WSF 3629]|nr:hypothetical protein VE00_06983 [Pseudogymnoascus sp. WSF 3629]
MSLEGYINSEPLPPAAPRWTPLASNPGGGYTEKVVVLTCDSRTLVGMMLSCDQMTNLILMSALGWRWIGRSKGSLEGIAANVTKVLGQTTERIIRPHDDEEPSSEVEHGLYIVRGDNVTVVGLVDEELDESINWNEVRGAVIGGVKHSA